MNGLRQVANDFLQTERSQKIVAWLIFILWLVVSIIGAIAILAAASNRLGSL